MGDKITFNIKWPKFVDLSLKTEGEQKIEELLNTYMGNPISLQTKREIERELYVLSQHYEFEYVWIQ